VLQMIAWSHAAIGDSAVARVQPRSIAKAATEAVYHAGMTDGAVARAASSAYKYCRPQEMQPKTPNGGMGRRGRVVDA
jgi:hypothetical protein